MNSSKYSIRKTGIPQQTLLKFYLLRPFTLRCVYYIVHYEYVCGRNNFCMLMSIEMGFNLNNSASLSSKLIFSVPEAINQDMWFSVFINFYTKTLWS